MHLDPAVVSAFAALIGSLIGGTMSVWAVKVGKDKEGSQRREEVERRAALQRIKYLYEPLVRAMAPSPPYDDFYLDRQNCISIINIVEKNERYASPDLLILFWRFRSAHYDDSSVIDSEMTVEFYDLALAEYAKLKELLGFGRIVISRSRLKGMLDKLLSRINYRWFTLSRMLRRLKRRNRRRS